MADSKISELPALTTPADDDLLAIVDTDSGATKKITVANLNATASGLTASQTEVLSHWTYDPIEDQLVSDVAIETTLNSLYLGGQHKVSSGAENVYFTNLTSDVNYYPAWGALKDQSIVANQGADGYIAPSGRVFGDMFSLPLGGTSVPGTAIGYDGDNYFGINISGLGITTIAAEAVPSTVKLQYRIVVNGTRVYSQTLPRVSSTRSTAGANIAIGDTINWFFDHPVDIVAGTTLRATIMKVRIADDVELGVFQVRKGDTADPTTGLIRYHTIVSNRLFEDKELEFAAPYLSKQAMDFALDSTGSVVYFKDLTLASNNRLLTTHPINSLEAVANGATIKIKHKEGAKVIIESLPVTGASVNGTLVNAVLNQAIIQLNTIFTNSAGFSSSGNSVNSFTLSGNNLTLGLSDGTSYTVDVTTLGVDENKFVSSGALSGTDLVLTMNDSSTVTIDATNMINGSTGLAVNANWFISYGANANTAVNHPQTNLAAGVAGNAPFYFGTPLTRGSEMKWNHTLVNKQSVFGIWAGTESTAGTYHSRVFSYNWSTAFKWFGAGFGDFNTNMDLITANNTASAYTPIQGSEMKLRFGTDGHLSLINVVSGAEVLVMKTTIPLSVTEFRLQMGSDENQNFPQPQVVDIESLWEVVHDYANIEGGIDNGILDHTVIKSGVSIVKGEKLMFMLDEVGQGDFFGTNYTNASTAILTAEEQLDNTFIYQTNEAIVMTFGGASDWTPNTSANGYFFAASLHQYRNGGGTGTVQGMHSLRFDNDGTLQLWDEDTQERIATATANPTIGSSIHLYFGVKGNRAYYSIPVVSKQSLTQGSQPVTSFVPTVADQTVSVTEATALNFTIVTSDNIVNQFVEVDAPSWMNMNQTTGVLSGTAPAYAGTSADTIVVNCKAGNAVGGHVAFTVTVTVAQVVASYTNNKSLSFDGSSSYLNGNATLMDSMDRATNGDGNAWSISMWIKPDSNTSVQTLFVYGSGSASTEGAIVIKKVNTNNITVTYGTYSSANIVTFGTAFTANVWSHVMVTFNGGTTGNDVADVADYYSRFKVYVNGSLSSTIGAQAGNGYTGSISGENTSDNIFRFGRNNNVHNEYFDGAINSMAIWGSDQSSNVSDIYNGGTLHNLSDLTNAPDHYYEIENSATTITDIEGSANLTGYNFAASDLVTDTP